MKVSLILPSFKRPKLLDLGLFSLAQQKINHDLEVFVLNDGIGDDTENICNKYKDKLNIKYIFTGQRNLNGEIIFRCPSYAYNIGIKQSKGEIIILSCPEIYHLNNSINYLIKPLINNKRILSTLNPKNLFFDNTEEVTNYIIEKLTTNLPKNMIPLLESNTKRCRYATKLPFFMGMYKKELVDIGGYDEDFTGFACDDDDLVGRLKLKGLKYYEGDAKIIHLYHDKQYNRKNLSKDERYLHNWKLLKERKGIIIRNKDREWGVMK